MDEVSEVSSFSDIGSEDVDSLQLSVEDESEIDNDVLANDANRQANPVDDLIDKEYAKQ